MRREGDFKAAFILFVAVKVVTVGTLTTTSEAVCGSAFH